MQSLQMIDHYPMTRCLLLSNHVMIGCFFITKNTLADKSPPSSHYMAQDELKNILFIKIALILGMFKAF